ncbi:phage tail sheath subtilisin-like domain-containing protein [Clostridium rectalis]|uniref:phage tail sheath subtilisin-like domain-containing protein n=1 Tax=Clostridium rectalis TaxID=2040295 RepID=UPI000F632099|nr:phage tail sheath subtilisin-like domain-containing protein [Clostridium rectalis]
MGLPNINIVFKTKASSVVKRGERGVVALIIKDTLNFEKSYITITDVKDIPSELSKKNKEQIELAFLGGVKAPKKVIVYILPTEAVDYKEAQNYLENIKWDYLAIPDISKEDCSNIVTWIKTLRDKKDKKVKAVLPHTAADYEGIINFSTDDIKVKEKVYNSSEYCGRIAGALAGTPLTMSATYLPLPEVYEVPHLTKEEFDKNIDEGQLILINDGEKIKIGRAINSLVTITQEKGADFKKILIVDKNDMWHDDVKRTVEDNYLGKYSNSYDNKILLITAIQAYNDELALERLLDDSSINYNKVFVDVYAQKAFLRSIGFDVSEMREQEIKEANTKDKVFIATNLKWTDAMEDFNINVSI